MARNRYVDTSFWGDNYVLDLDPSEKLLFLYFLTNDRTNIAGIYEIAMRKVCMETGYDKEMVEKILKRFTEQRKIYYVEGHIIVRNFIRYQSLNPKIEKGIATLLEGLPERLQKVVHLKDSGLWLEAPGDESVLLVSQINTAWLKDLREREDQATKQRALNRDRSRLAR